ncbi:hypothetical protein FRC08_014180 [Ceratobasidium sp. 394]|nr:hypothetical protein FRC08_014180 [Ceratobasidium sp. 394]
MDTHPSIYDAAFRHWKSARTTLTRAIDDYLAASSELCDTISFTAFHFSTRYSLEQSFSAIDLELSSLQSEEEKLKQTRATLANERNRFGTLVPIRRLPPRLLAAIFAIASGRYTRHDRTASSRAVHVSPTVLASVCSSWRKLALRSPSLWSYIDIIVDSDINPRCYMQARLWVERSQNASLQVRVRGHNHYYCHNHSLVVRNEVTRLVEFLAPLMCRVHVLDLRAALDHSGIFWSVMECWIRNGSANIEKTLQVFNHFSDGWSDFSLDPPSTPASVEEFNAFFQTINRLFVRNCGISGDIVFHEGLVELHLEDINRLRSLTQQKFVAILTACPRLRILALANCWIEPSDSTISPVTLNHLHSLSLETDDLASGFAPVLPLLHVGSNALSMSLTMENDSDFIAGAKAFFSRTKVTKLCVRDRQGQTLTALLCPIPHLETLALDNCNISGWAFEQFFRSNGEVLWPRLRTLYLRDSSIDTSCLQKLVVLHPSIEKLQIYRPYAAGHGKKILTEEERGHLQELMHTVEDYDVDFTRGNGPIDAWDFVILD